MTGRTPEKRRRWRKELLARAASDPSIRDRAGHGRWYTYNDLGCKCTECLAACAEKSRSYAAHRAGLVCDSLSCVRCVLGGDR